MRVACVVEYDGAGFHGWQLQAAGTRTIQGTLEAALARVADEPVATICAGRTDSGVHACGQVVHFDTTARRAEKAWVMGANTHLSADVTVRRAVNVPDSFSARYDARARTYRYLIHEGWDRPALSRARVAWTHCVLDVEAMRAGAQYLIGEHDFSAFRAAGCQARHPVRELQAIEVQREPGCVRIDVRANAFLHNMVRIIVGTLMAVGRGEYPPAWVEQVLRGRDRTVGASTAPAQGLYFLGPSYAPELGIPTPIEPRVPPIG